MTKTNAPSRNAPNQEKGGSMSRAAKKRAKKRQKKHVDEEPDYGQEQPDYNDDDDDMDNEDPTPTKKQRMKQQREPIPKSKTKKAEALPKKQDDDDDDDDDDYDTKRPPVDNNNGSPDDDSTNDLVQELVSRLTPAQILQLPDATIPDSLARTTVGTEDVDVRELVQELTSVQRAKGVLQSMLGGMPLSEFYTKHWEREPLLVQKKNTTDATTTTTTNSQDQPDHEDRLKGFLSLERIRTMTETVPLAYGRDLNVTKYVRGVDGVKRRLTLDQVNERDKDATDEDADDDFVLADAKDLWANFESGCTIRLLCPHQHSDETLALLSMLELEWGCMVGSNAYLTPAGAAQGFAPHYDDICAYILQLEGRKHWKVYAPMNKRETLPRTSSRDFTEDDLKGMEPVMDVVLSTGDLLYLPRGWIHQACTLPEGGTGGEHQHSLHLTVSAMQQWAWVDYLELLIPQALEAAAESELSTSLRQGLPRNFLEYMGAVHDQPEDPEELKALTRRENIKVNDDDVDQRRQLEKDRLRSNFIDEAKKRIMRVTKEAISMIDAACDQIGKRFLSDRLPPALTSAEAALTSEHRNENGGKIWPNTLVRLARPGIARLVLEDDKAVLYQCMDNSRVYHGNPLSPLEFEMDDAPAIEAMVTTVEPHWIMVKDLIHDDIEDKMEIAQSLYDEGILAILQTEKPDRSAQTK
jgi:bifunctional lysine-specific demethylase and histidyl-hydroxylase NO66